MYACIHTCIHGVTLINLVISITLEGPVLSHMPVCIGVIGHPSIHIDLLYSVYIRYVLCEGTSFPRLLAKCNYRTHLKAIPRTYRLQWRPF